MKRAQQGIEGIKTPLIPNVSGNVRKPTPVTENEQ